MTAITAASNEIIAEHFGCPPLAFIDEVINAMNVVIGDTALEAESTLFGASPSTLGFRDPPGTIRELDPDGRPMLSPSEQSELNQGLHQFETLMESGLDIGFDAFELFVLRNILVVREDLCPWIRLEHHKDLNSDTVLQLLAEEKEKEKTTAADTPVTPATASRARLRHIRDTYIATYAFNRELEDESSSNELILDDLRTLTSTLISDLPDPSQPSPWAVFSNIHQISSLKDKAEFVISQLDLVRKLVDDLKPHHQELMRRLQNTDAESQSKEAEREAYIQKMTRGHVEIVRGLRLNEKGEVIGGDYEADDGISKDAEEVKMLEEIADKLGK